jgi:cell division transport system permease protein
MRARMNFYVSEALRSLSTNKATSFAAVIAMLLALVIVGITAVGFVTAKKLGDRVQRDASMVEVFLTDSASEGQVNALKLDLEKNPAVDNVKYVSKEEALKRAKKLFEDSPGVMENLPGNPFPKSLEATLKDPTAMSSVVKSVDGQPGVDSVEGGNAREKRAISVAKIFTASLFAIGVGILIAATVLVANTIRLSIYSRRREIEVMKLVGASNGFVRMPFMIEGLLCGLFASTIAIIGVVGIVKLLSSTFRGFLSAGTLGAGGSDVSLPMIALGLLGLGIALGMFGSATSMRKYLRT